MQSFHFFLTCTSSLNPGRVADSIDSLFNSSTLSLLLTHQKISDRGSAVGIEELSATSSTPKNDSIFDPLDPNSTWATSNSNANTSDTREPVQSPTSPDSPLGLGSLGRLPSEIRNLVYKKLMMAEKMIEDVYKLVGTKKVVMEADCPRIKGLSVIILRNSRAIYQEGLPILYG